MLFNSIEFLIFLPIVFTFYWFIFNKNLSIQNFIILLSSYIFYGWWDYRFLSLIFLSTIVDYIIGLNIPRQESEKLQKLLLYVSILFNVSVLGFFKYYNFFIDSWVSLFSSFGYEIKSIWTLNIILPVGISFYTFQTMSYTIDIYRKKLKPTKDFISFASFVSFFPQLVAGPIERATNLLPQILNKREFRYEQGVQGLRLILWGLFKKVVIADSLSPIVDDIFSNYQDFSGGTLWLGAVYFAFQIYCDFSGYSDIAIGTSKLFGFEIMSNFRFPYFSRNIGEFWRRWHISLSTWFRDYLYIPLGGSKEGKWKSIRNIFVIFIVSGFWHGANWTFILWGLLHSILILIYRVIDNFLDYKKYISLRILSHIFSISFIMLAWIPFRTSSIIDALEKYKIIFSFNNYFELGLRENIYLITFILMLGIYISSILNPFYRRFSNYYFFNLILNFLIGLLLLPIILAFLKPNNQFIYFQF